MFYTTPILQEKIWKSSRNWKNTKCTMTMTMKNPKKYKEALEKKMKKPKATMKMLTRMLTRMLMKMKKMATTMKMTKPANPVLMRIFTKETKSNPLQKYINLMREESQLANIQMRYSILQMILQNQNSTGL